MLEKIIILFNFKYTNYYCYELKLLNRRITFRYFFNKEIFKDNFVPAGSINLLYEHHRQMKSL